MTKEGFIETHFPDYGSPEILKVTYKGNGYKEYSFVEEARKIIEKEKKDVKNEKWKLRADKVKVYSFFLSFFLYPIIDFVIKMITDKSILDFLF